MNSILKEISEDKLKEIYDFLGKSIYDFKKKNVHELNINILIPSWLCQLIRCRINSIDFNNSNFNVYQNCQVNFHYKDEIVVYCTSYYLDSEFLKEKKLTLN